MNVLSRLRPGTFRPSPRAARLALDAAVGLALFCTAHAVYRSSTGTVQLCDSTYSLVVAEKFLTAGTLDLQDCIPAAPAARAALPGYRPGHDLPYHLVRRPNPGNPTGPPRVFYGYPLGSTALLLPFVRYYVRDKGMSLLDPDGVPRYQTEGTIQVRIASRVAAATVVLFYVLARFYGSPLVAGSVAAGFALGSPVWSTLARALWSHTWMVFWLTAAVVLLAAARRTPGRTRAADLAFGAGLGTAFFWAGFCRQHAAVSAAAVGVYLLWCDRRLLAFTLLAGGAWVIALVAGSFTYFGSPLPPSVYAAGMIDGRDVLTRFTWLMVSPARGLLVFCPYLGVVAVLLAAGRGRPAAAGLLVPAGIAVVGHTAVLACYNGWHGNWAYGPRYFCDVLPWFVLAAAVAANGLAARPGGWRKVAAGAALAAAFGWGVFVHARGANAEPAWFWNDLTRAVGDEAAVEDWRYPQFMAGITFRVRPDGSVEEF